MKAKLFQLMLAVLMVCGLGAFTSCSNDDKDNSIENLSEKILGTWVEADINGHTALTNEKSAVTFLSATKAINSQSRVDFTPTAPRWNANLEFDVQISGNKVTLTGHPNDSITLVKEYNITAVNESEMFCDYKHTTYCDGRVILLTELVIRFVKVADYTTEVLGLWECTGLSGGETYNDGNDRLEFLSDGTYRFYHKDDAGQWQTVTTREFQNYFVDGTLLATRWKNQGEDELREWWEIESISGDEMVWTALRQKEDGSTFKQKMTWKKIDLKVAEKILGKWMTADKDGNPAPTDEKSVFTFISTTKAIACASKNTYSDSHSRWSLDREYDVEINGNYVKLTSHSDGSSTMIKEFAITSINDAEFVCRYKHTTVRDGQITSAGSEQIRRYTKIIPDFRTAIVGTWEGHCTSAGSVFDDGQEHRWQYNADGTYVYYVKDGDNWVPSENTLNEYFVDGTLLCTRWIDLGQENREWWEINIDGDKMNWTALRENPDGTTFTATFEMKKVE